jgi:hypothetical protein
MLDKFTLIRSVDATDSNHEPNQVFQTGNREAEPRINPRGHLYPAIGSVIAKHNGSNKPGMPPYVAFMRSRSHLAFGGYLGKRYDPFDAAQASKLPIYTNVGINTGQQTGADLFHLPKGIQFERITERRTLLKQFDGLRAELDNSGVMDAMDAYGCQLSRWYAPPLHDAPGSTHPPG